MLAFAPGSFRSTGGTGGKTRSAGGSCPCVHDAPTRVKGLDGGVGDKEREHGTNELEPQKERGYRGSD